MQLSARIFSLATEITQLIHNPNQVISAISHFWDADAGSFWELNQQSDGNSFVLKGSFNRPKLTEGKRYRYRISDKSTASAMAFQSREPMLGVIGEGFFSGDWLKKDITSDLIEMGIKNVIIIPVFSSSGDPLCSMSLYKRSNFHAVSIETLINFSTFFSVHWETYHQEMSKIKRINGTFRHEVDNQVLGIERECHDLASRLRTIEQLAQSPQLQREDRKDLTHATDSIRYAARVGIRSVTDIRTALRTIKRSQTDKEFFMGVVERKSDARHIDLREVINATSNMLLKGVSRDLVAMSTIDYPRPDISVLITRTEIQHIFTNIFSNAIKYSFPGSTIIVRVVEDKLGLSVTVQNLSNPIDDEEIGRLWSYGYRGEGARAAVKDGNGIGLAVIKTICDVYDIGYEFWQSSSEIEGRKWSKIRLNFPKKMVG
ncbi:sensor histidine kinase [Cereibacter sphaeroides]|jgi:signal transduction histidine kinase|uniref:sensor histidine kinase n=1 Tax=Cereibacter sphaeroides TaxID=1063 RepID=UPI0000F2A283|nr:histidine kinase [Cereibacter sphaeroides ATCC 17029]